MQIPSTLTANNVECTQRHEWKNVEILVFGHCLIQLVDQDETLLVENVNKVLEDFKMERWCQQFTAGLPLATCHKNLRGYNSDDQQ